jgi:hypothetical protein
MRLRWSTDPVLPPTPTFPVLSTSNAKDRGVGQVPHFMRQEPETLAPPRGLAVERGLISPVPNCVTAPADGVVETSVQRAEVIRADAGVHLHGEAGDGLTDVAVVHHDL